MRECVRIVSQHIDAKSNGARHGDVISSSPAASTCSAELTLHDSCNSTLSAPIQCAGTHHEGTPVGRCSRPAHPGRREGMCAQQVARVAAPSLTTQISAGGGRHSGDLQERRGPASRLPKEHTAGEPTVRRGCERNSCTHSQRYRCQSFLASHQACHSTNTRANRGCLNREGCSVTGR